MKLVGDKANNYFSNPDASHTAILIYGADTCVLPYEGKNSLMHSLE